METSYAFVDFQGFKDNSNRFVVKEFALLTKNIKLHDIIKSPVFVTLDEKHQKQAKWLTENYHGLDWRSENISLTELRNKIQPILKKKIIYLKGEEKVKWFHHIFGHNNNTKSNSREVINLESIACTINLHKKDENIRNKFHSCKYHHYLKNKKNPNCHCAMENVLILYTWYFFENKSKINELYI